MRNPSSSASAGEGPQPAKTPCCSKVGLKRGPWTPEEDELLVNYIKKEGEGRWRTLPKRAGLLRCGKSCRLRWMNYLRPCVKRGQIAPDEEDLILRLHRLLGNRWSLIAGRIPGRTDNEIKNYWNTHLSKKLISQGIDPRNHKPLNLESVDHQKASSSSKANRKTSGLTSNNNNSTIAAPSSGVEETNSGGSTQIISNKENVCIENTSLDHHYQFTENNNADPSHGYSSLLNCGNGTCGMHLISNAQGLSNEEDEEINYSTDDVFSSFLNSLINEEAFTSQQMQQEANLIVPSSDPLVSTCTSTFGDGPSWESVLMSPTNQNDPSKRVNDHLH